MDIYRVHSVTIAAEDRDKANEILETHDKAGDIDKMYAERDYVKMTITYYIAPYIYEDFEAIVNEFKENGIQVL